MWLSLSLLVACSNVRAPNPLELSSLQVDIVAGPEEFEKLQVMTRSGAIAQQTGEGINYIRMEAVRDTALSVGARSALAWRSGQINKIVATQASYLDGVFNFNSLILDDEVLPPVLLESRNALNVDGPHNIRVADRSYRIVKQARFVTTPPTWREYLLMDERSPEPPDPTLLPQTQEEQAAWQKGVVEGWAAGIKQANEIYAENLARLKRDYQGMVRYRMLLAQRMVTAPQVAHRELGVTGGGEVLSVNDRILTIKALPSLQADSSAWAPSVAP
jgi:defect-in-organelle-trafficking protein DotC